MELEVNYTTLDKINLDKDGKESEKTIISNEAFALCTAINELIVAINASGVRR